MTPTARRRPLEALEISLRRLRILGVLFVVGATVIPRGPTSLTIAGALLTTAFVLLLLTANAASKRMSAPGVSVERLVLAQLVIDIVVTSGALLHFEPQPGTFGWVAVGLPVLEGAMRYRLIGAASAWLAIATTLLGSTIIGWSPGDGLGTIVDLAGMLSIGLGLGIPAGHIADQLTEELLAVADQRHDAQYRSRLLAVLAVAGNDLTILDERELCRTAAQATIELGYRSAEVGIVDLGTAEWHAIESHPPAALAPTLSENQASQIAGTAVGSLIASVVGRDVLGVLHTNSIHSTVLLARIGHDDERSPPRTEALAMLCATTATALAAAARHEELNLAREQLQYDATHDALTGLLNRAGLLAALESALVQVDTERRSRTIIMIDLDRFKAVNDSHGHEAGDAVLVAVGKRLLAAAPARTTVARLGGDEFVLVIADRQPTDLQQRLEHLVKQPIAIRGGDVRVGASIGVHLLDDPTCTAAEALRQADAKMYANKRGRDISR